MKDYITTISHEADGRWCAWSSFNDLIKCADTLEELYNWLNSEDIPQLTPEENDLLTELIASCR